MLLSELMEISDVEEALVAPGFRVHEADRESLSLRGLRTIEGGTMDNMREGGRVGGNRGVALFRSEA